MVGYVNGDVRYIKHYRNGKFLGEREIEAYGDGTPEIPARIRINGLAAAIH